jgi:5'-3' exonuclease
MKIALTLDGNYLLFKNVFALKKTKTIYGDLKKAMLENARKYASMFSYENKFFVSDLRSPSWRKKLYKEYKAKRKKDVDINWDRVYEIYDEIKKEIAELGFHVIEIDGAEGDDLIHLIIRRNMKLGISNLVVSADRDMLQLLSYNIGDNAFINLQVDDKYGQEQIFVKTGYQIAVSGLGYRPGAVQTLSELLNLNSVNTNHESLKNLLDKWPIRECDPKEVLFRKIIEGDGGDNIISAYRTEVKKKDGTTGFRGIGKDTGKKMWDIYQQYQMAESIVGSTNTALDVNSPDFIYDVISIIESVKKVKLEPAVREQLEDNLKFNIKMVELNIKHIPKPLLENIAARIKECY